MMELILFIAIIDYAKRNYYQFDTFTLEDFERILINYVSFLKNIHNDNGDLENKDTNFLSENTPEIDPEVIIPVIDDIVSEDVSLNEEVSENKIDNIIKKDFSGTTVSVLINNLGIITGELVFNLKDIIALKLSNDIIIFINNDAISGFY